MASCRVENRAKKAQNGTVSASQLVKASQNAIFFSTQQISIVLLYCVQSLVGKGRFLATKRAQKRVCIVCLASAAILPFLVTSPDIQFWLSAALLCLQLISFIVMSIIKTFTNDRFYQEGFPLRRIKTRHEIKHSKMKEKHLIKTVTHVFMASQ